MASPDRASGQLKREASTENFDSDETGVNRTGHIKDENSSTLGSPDLRAIDPDGNKPSSSPIRNSQDLDDIANIKDEKNGTIGHVSPKRESSRPSKSNRAASSKNPPRIAPLFDDLPDLTDEAKKGFTVIEACTYQNKYLGYTEHAMECDCLEEWSECLLKSTVYLDACIH